MLEDKNYDKATSSLFPNFWALHVFSYLLRKRREKGKVGVADSVNKNDVVWSSIPGSTVFGGSKGN